MAIQRIDIPASHTHGWQARAHLTGDQRLTAFFSDTKHGGPAGAEDKALRAAKRLQNKARKLRRIQS